MATYDVLKTFWNGMISRVDEVRFGALHRDGTLFGNFIGDFYCSLHHLLFVWEDSTEKSELQICV